MSIDYAILGLLSWRPLTGYDIKKMFEDSVALYWSGNNNQIYRTLVGLHKDELVSMDVEHPESGPARKVYRITRNGTEKLREWVLSEPAMPELRHTFLIQLAWADQLRPDEIDDLLARYEGEVHEQWAMLRARRKQKTLSPDGAPREAYIDPAKARTPREAWLWEQIQDNWIAFYEHELNWVRKLRKDLQQRARE
jgi:PadR family transcriptional regulator, regulatory protein AphA